MTPPRAWSSGPAQGDSPVVAVRRARRALDAPRSPRERAAPSLPGAPGVAAVAFPTSTASCRGRLPS